MKILINLMYLETQNSFSLRSEAHVVTMVKANALTILPLICYFVVVSILFFRLEVVTDANGSTYTYYHHTTPRPDPLPATNTIEYYKQVSFQ